MTCSQVLFCPLCPPLWHQLSRGLSSFSFPIHTPGELASSQTHIFGPSPHLASSQPSRQELNQMASPSNCGPPAQKGCFSRDSSSSLDTGEHLLGQQASSQGSLCTIPVSHVVVIFTGVFLCPLTNPTPPLMFWKTRKVILQD